MYTICPALSVTNSTLYMHTITMVQSIILSLHHCIRNRPLFWYISYKLHMKEVTVPPAPGIYKYNAQTRALFSLIMKLLQLASCACDQWDCCFEPYTLVTS